MRVSKLRVLRVGFLLVVLVGSSPIGADEEKSKANAFFFACKSTVKIVGGQKGVDPVDIYACPNSRLTWDLNGHSTFQVIFKRKECPFKDAGSCRNINQDHSTSSSDVKDYPDLTVFDYEILVDGELYDPHVVGGGHHSP